MRCVPTLIDRVEVFETNFEAYSEIEDLNTRLNLFHRLLPVLLLAG